MVATLPYRGRAYPIVSHPFAFTRPSTAASSGWKALAVAGRLHGVETSEATQHLGAGRGAWGEALRGLGKGVVHRMIDQVIFDGSVTKERKMLKQDDEQLC